MTDPTPPLPTLAIWHGYLLGATGSNIYTHHLVQSWVRAGHDVVLACQESEPAKHPSITDVVKLRWNEERTGQEVAERRAIREPAPGEGRCTMVVPDIDALLPVYVLDRYAGFEVHRLVDLDGAQRERYAAAQAAAMRWVLAEHAPAGVLINHATPLPAALQPVLEAAGVPYAVKVHGSELEYALVDDPSLAPAAAAALTASSAVLVGSDHIERRTAELLGRACIEGHVATVPPGVDLEHFVPSAAGAGGDDVGRADLCAAVATRVAAESGGRGATERANVKQLVANVGGDPERAAELVGHLRELQGSYQERNIEATAEEQLDAISADARLVTFVGKLIPQKGVHLLVAALPDLVRQHPDTHLVVAGFGPLRDVLEAMLFAMQAGDAAALDALAATGGTLAGESIPELVGLAEFLDDLRARGELGAWLERAGEQRIAERVAWLGLVDHSILRLLWPECETSVVPSILAEAFGMVAAEAAACGCVPLVSDHSGLADAAAVIELDGVQPVRFSTTGAEPTIQSLADALIARLALPDAERQRQALAARANVAAAWGWDQLSVEVADLMVGGAVAGPTRGRPGARPGGV